MTKHDDMYKEIMADIILETALEVKQEMDKAMLGDYPDDFEQAVDESERQNLKDSILVVDRKTGCYFKGTDLTHTNKCACGDYND